MEAYMRMIGASKAVWNQRMGCTGGFKGGGPTQLPYIRDDDLWATVVRGLQVFMIRASEAMGDINPKKQQKL